MAGLNFIGSYSGIDQAMIDSLMEAHKMPLVSMSNKKTNITEKQNAWKDINTRLNSLFEKMKNLQQTSTFTSKNASSTDDKMVSVSVGSAAPAGSYDIKVGQLATSTRIIGGEIPKGSFDDKGNLNVSGSFSINGLTININNDDEEDSYDVENINDLTKAINKAIEVENNSRTQANKELKAGEEKAPLIKVNATAIGGKLVLTNEETGDRDINLGGDEGTLASLGLKEVKDENGKNIGMTTIEGQKAEFTINGVSISNDSNTVTDAIEGMTINLHRAHDEDNPRDYETLTVDTDMEKATKAVKEFVDQYNSTMIFLEDLTKAGDPEVAGSRGKLAGESALVRLQSRLRNLVTDTVSRDKDSINDISQLGVATKGREGDLHFDSAKFTEMMKENPNKVIDFFKGTGAKDKDGKTIENGYAARLNTEINSYISTKKDENGRVGIIKSTMETYDKTIKNLNKQIERFNDRMEKKEAYYIKTFSALDVAMMQAESQMQWLQGQVDAMNGIKR